MVLVARIVLVAVRRRAQVLAGVVVLGRRAIMVLGQLVVVLSVLVPVPIAGAIVIAVAVAAVIAVMLRQVIPVAIPVPVVVSVRFAVPAAIAVPVAVAVCFALPTAIAVPVPVVVAVRFALLAAIPVPVPIVAMSGKVVVQILAPVAVPRLADLLERMDALRQLGAVDAVPRPAAYDLAEPLAECAVAGQVLELPSQAVEFLPDLSTRTQGPAGPRGWIVRTDGAAEGQANRDCCHVAIHGVLQ
jgi:hypothetical protein